MFKLKNFKNGSALGTAALLLLTGTAFWAGSNLAIKKLDTSVPRVYSGALGGVLGFAGLVAGAHPLVTGAAAGLGVAGLVNVVSDLTAPSEGVNGIGGVIHEAFTVNGMGNVDNIIDWDDAINGVDDAAMFGFRNFFKGNRNTKRVIKRPAIAQAQIATGAQKVYRPSVQPAKAAATQNYSDVEQLVFNLNGLPEGYAEAPIL